MPNRGEYADSVRKRLEAKRREDDTVRMPLKPRVPDSRESSCSPGTISRDTAKIPGAIGGLGTVGPVGKECRDSARRSTGDTSNGAVPAVAEVDPHGMASKTQPYQETKLIRDGVTGVKVYKAWNRFDVKGGFQKAFEKKSGVTIGLLGCAIALLVLAWQRGHLDMPTILSVAKALLDSLQGVGQ